MRKIVIYCIAVLILVGCRGNVMEAEIPFVEGEVISIDEDAYAIWGVDQEGRRFEYRYEMAVVRYEDGNIDDKIGVVRMWFDRESPSLPKVGACVRIPRILIQSKCIPVNMKTINVTDIQVVPRKD